MAESNGRARRARLDRVTRRAPADGDRQAVESMRLGPLAELIGFHLRKAQNASFQAFARRVGQTDLNPGTFALLTLIQHNPGISQTALSHADGRDKSSLTPALNALERHGLVLRQRLPNNRRTYALRLTTAGERILLELAQHADAHDRDLDSIVGLQHKSWLIILLRRIVAGLAGLASDPDSGPPRAAGRTRRSAARARAGESGAPGGDADKRRRRSRSAAPSAGGQAAGNERTPASKGRER